MKSLLAGAVAVALFGASASAALINFDSTPAGIYNSLVFADLTITYTGGDGDFDVEVANPGAPISGHALISFRQNPGPAPFRVDFTSGAASSFSIGVGDFNQDIDIAFLEAYSASNVLLDSDTYTNPGPLFGGATLGVSSASAIAYVLFWENGPNPGAVYWDELEYELQSVQGVPEPSTLALAGMGMGIVTLARRRRNAA